MILTAVAVAGAVTVDARAFALEGHGCRFDALAKCEVGEPLVWDRSPSDAAVMKAFPRPAPTWLHAHLLCRGLAADGKLVGCRADVDPSGPDQHGINKRLEALMKSFSVGRKEAARLRPNTSLVSVAVQVRFEGVSDRGRCAEFAFCTIVPAPPQPGQHRP